jgi:hypothetical protein
MTLYLSNRDGLGKTSEEGHYRLQTQVFSGDVLNTTALQVTQNSPTGMSILIAPGDFKIYSGNDYSYTGWNSASLPVTITTADPANPRITTIVLYVDKSAATAPSPANNPGVIKAKAINGTPGAVPAVPNGATIQAAVGAGNPYIILANVTVGTGISTILNANISDQRQMLTMATGFITSASIKDSNVTTPKIADQNVTTTKIADSNVTTAKIANNAVTAAKMETQQAWITPTLLNGWVAHTPGSYPTAGYYKDSLGQVNLQGLLKNGTIGATVFTLPAGYRPLYQIHIAIASNGAFANISIYPNGNVQIQNGNNGWIALDAISFRAEQ